ncbi:DUF1353 domain-containing protein [uncultured Gilvimarinus sp.]|uniref:DUF1353 domain-containing protein n=1 Tax=uncultured Gilvimarinus sp. TaxID=1689143 RepID=UPI0030DC5DDB
MITLFGGPYQGVKVCHLPGGKRVQLLEDIHLPNGDIVPAGFTCDTDSVPRLLGPLYAWFKGRSILGAIVHDFCYRKKIPRAECDVLFLQAMTWEGVRKRYRYPIYYAVRAFGRFHY